MVEEIGMDFPVWSDCIFNGRKSENYEVSNYGEVRNKSSKETVKPNNILTNNYVRYSIGGTVIGAHRLVLSAFIPLKNDELYKVYQVNHIDGDKHNNRLDNLEWVTRKENMAHAFENELVGGVLKVNKYTMDGEYLQTYKTGAEAERDLGASSGTLSSVLIESKTPTYAGFQWHLDTGDNRKKISPIGDYKRGSSNGGVYQIDLITGELLNHFDSLVEAYLFLNKQDNGFISSVCRGKKEGAWGYDWKYATDVDKTFVKHKLFGTGRFNNIMNSIHLRALREYGGVYKLNTDLEILDFYNTEAETYKERGSSNTGFIGRKCKEENIEDSMAWGFYWRYGKDVKEQGYQWKA